MILRIYYRLASNNFEFSRVTLVLARGNLFTKALKHLSETTVRKHFPDWYKSTKYLGCYVAFGLTADRLRGNI